MGAPVRHLVPRPGSAAPRAPAPTLTAVRRFRLLHHLRTSLWVLPVVMVAGGALLSLLTLSLDPVGELVPQDVSGDPNAALQVLYLISFAMLTLTGLVLSLVVVAVQLAMGTFSPRIVRQILHDRPSQAAIGLFAGTFTHSLLTMRGVRTTPDGGTVPGLAVLVAIVLVLACIAALVWYLNHIAQSLRTAALVEWVAEDVVATIEDVYPDPGPPPGTAEDLIQSDRSGVLFALGSARLVGLARDGRCRLELLWSVGDYVPVGAPLFRVVGDEDGLDRATVLRCVVLGPERTLNQDVAYGLRLLVDIAGRSLASGPYGDPTTVVQAIDRLQDIMRQISRRPIPDGTHRDASGTVRLLVPTITWEGLVHVAFDEIRQAGAGSPQVSRRLGAALEDLLLVAPPERRAPLQLQLDLLGETSSRAALTATDREAAVVADVSGIGSAAGLLSRDPRTGPGS